MYACFNFLQLIWNCSWYFRYKLVPGTLDLSSFLPVHQNDDQIFSSFIFSAQSTPFIKRLFRPLSYPIEFILGRVYFQSFGRSVERRIGAITFARREQSFTWQWAETLRSMLWGIPRGSYLCNYLSLVTFNLYYQPPVTFDSNYTLSLQWTEIPRAKEKLTNLRHKVINICSVK